MISGKKYIGSDSNNNPYYLGSGVGLVKAISKYGRDNFKKEILAEASNFKEMRELESFYIQKYNAHKSWRFYNRSDKGHGQGNGDLHWNFGKKLNESTKKKKSISMKGKKIHSSKSKNTLSEKMKKEWLTNPNLKNRKIPKENIGARKVVLQYDLDGNLIKRWDYKNQISKKLGYNRVSIGNVCNPNHPQKTYKGFIWKYE